MLVMGQWRQQTTMACVYLCNNTARSAHVLQNLKYNNNKKNTISLFVTQRINARGDGYLIYPDVIITHCMPVSKYPTYSINIYT